MKSRRKTGFTLIEVTLAIVIGIIMIAGATLIYNQAKTSAGNSRAQAKVVALQQLIEEFAAQNQGIYPSVMHDVNALWVRKRPDDWNKSPWGGVLGTAYVPTTAFPGGVGVANGAITGETAGSPPVGGTAGVSIGSLGGTALPSSPTWVASRPATVASASVVTASTPTMVGGLFYDFSSFNAAWTYNQDIMTNRAVTVKGYAVYIADQVGRYPNFVTGGKDNN